MDQEGERPLVKKRMGSKREAGLHSRDRSGALSGVSMKAGYQRSTAAFLIIPLFHSDKGHHLETMKYEMRNKIMKVE